MNATFHTSSINLIVAPVKSIGVLERCNNTLHKWGKYSWILLNGVHICEEYFIPLHSYTKIFTQLVRDSTGDIFFPPQLQDIEELSNIFKCKYKIQFHQ